MLFVALALTCLPQGTPVATMEKTAESAPYFEATLPIVIPSWGEGAVKHWTNFDLVRAYEQSTGHVIVATPQAEEILSRRPTLCDDPQTIAPGDVQVRFEKSMAGWNLVLLPSNEAAPRLVWLATRPSRNILHLPLEPHLIDWTETRRYSGRAGSLIRTVVPVQGADARALTNELRGWITDANVCQTVPLAGTNCVLVQGPGIEVARLTDALRAPARKAGLEMPALNTAEPAPKRDASGDGEFAGLQLTIPARGEGGWSVADLCDEYSRLSGVLVTIDSDAATQAKSTTVGLSEDLQVEGFDVSHTFEFLCRVKGFYLAPEENSTGLTLRQMRHGKLAVAAPQKIENLASWGFHPAHVVEVDVPLKEFDPRIMANVLRAIIGSPKIDRMGWESGSQVLRISGFAPTVAGRIALFQRAEELAEALRTADSNREK